MGDGLPAPPVPVQKSEFVTRFFDKTRSKRESVAKATKLLRPNLSIWTETPDISSDLWRYSTFAAAISFTGLSQRAARETNRSDGGA
jgi:hypothetical protein